MELLNQLFGNRTIAIVTMHQKQSVIEPLIRKYLPVDNVIVASIDTDKFGTFSGEIERQSDALTTVRSKIHEGLRWSGQTLGIGNEGSFGPHPHSPFVPADEELVTLIDIKNNLEISERYLTSVTNHSHRIITSYNDLIEFAHQIRFPSHGIILKREHNGVVTNVAKGVRTFSQLRQTYETFYTSDCSLVAETDMRAHMNPTRMNNIKIATQHLMERIISLCPKCGSPGFGVGDIRKGLPCRQCSYPTDLILSKIYYCQNCNYADERLFTNGEKADPQYCDQCNP